MIQSITRVFVVDDHAIFRAGLATVVDLQEDMQCVGEAESGHDASEQLTSIAADVVITDLQMPHGDGLWLASKIKSNFRRVRTLVLTTFDGDFDVLHCMQAGAHGFLGKDAPKEDLLAAVRAVALGQQYLPSELAAKVATVVRGDHLTTREREILQLVAEGLANKEVARELGITEGTVKTHMNNMMTKLEVKGRTEAVVAALRRGIIRL